jgi:DNA adenine methylase
MLRTTLFRKFTGPRLGKPSPKFSTFTRTAEVRSLRRLAIPRRTATIESTSPGSSITLWAPLMRQPLLRPGFRTKSDVRPFLKWTGGKRWLLPEIRSVLPARYNRYFEPFLGGGALFFHLQPWPALLSDLNPELMSAYRQVRDNVEEVIARLSRLEICPTFYREIRSKNSRLACTQAVRFLYLNRTAFNGIYRVNRQGGFNTPFGCKPGTILCEAELLRSASRALQNRCLRRLHFGEAIAEARAGDLVYADPPYTTKHNNNGFRRYNEVLFSWKDQERLAECCRSAAQRGVHVIVSNASHAPVIRLYHGFTIKRVARRSLISGPVKGRCDVTESLIYRINGS